jgi:hypothetical protein
MKKLFLFIILALIAPLHFLAAQRILPGYSGFWNRTKEISVLDILEYYPDRLPYLRNEIYARYGRPFAARTYQDYFNRQSWYRVRADYTDAWLSEADLHNAGLLRSIEQAPSIADTISLLERNAEYKSPEYLLIFNSSGVIEMETAYAADSESFLEMYGGDIAGWVQPYLVIGDWVVLYYEAYSDTYGASLFRLDHRTKTITAHVRDYIRKAALTPLIQAQDRLRASRG